MNTLQTQLLELLLVKNAIRFGSFKTKSGRSSPYFIDMGAINSGISLNKISNIYAKHIAKEFNDKTDNLFGPAYKGIPLCTSISMSLSNSIKKEETFTFNRKEEKQHGERGTIIGYRYIGKENVVIVEDILTAGTSIKETIICLKTYDVNILGCIVAVDREEKGKDDRSARQEIYDDHGIRIQSILKIREIFEILMSQKILDKYWIESKQKKDIKDYISKYIL